jgi:hypothetical protein
VAEQQPRFSANIRKRMTSLAISLVSLNQIGRGIDLQVTVNVEVVCGDALDVDADVLTLKYARAFYGVDNEVASRLRRYTAISDMSPPIGDFRIISTRGAITARRVLFVGVVDLYDFNYLQIRHFSIDALTYLAEEAPSARVVALTVHGPGYGLDESECFLSELGGIVEAVTLGNYPPAMTTVKIVEFDRRRVERLNKLLESNLPEGLIEADERTLRRRLGRQRSENLRAVGYDSGGKPHVFVAMPFSENMTDLFHYGIRQAVSSNGFLCERIDLEPAVGDVLARIKDRIRTARWVIAELTDASPNVYLEVGYAWGSGVPTILVIKKDQVGRLCFDVAGQRCVLYSSIRDLEEKLSLELSALASQSA